MNSRPGKLREKDNRAGTASRNRTERMGVPCPWLLLPIPQVHIFWRHSKGHRAVGQNLLKGSREVLFGISDFLSSIRGGREAGWMTEILHHFSIQQLEGEGHSPTSLWAEGDDYSSARSSHWSWAAELWASRWPLQYKGILSCSL